MQLGLQTAHKFIKKKPCLEKAHNMTDSLVGKLANGKIKFEGYSHTCTCISRYVAHCY